MGCEMFLKSSLSLNKDALQHKFKKKIQLMLRIYLKTIFFRNGECVDRQKVCDGILDCEDNSDEQNCDFSSHRHSLHNQVYWIVRIIQINKIVIFYLTSTGIHFQTRYIGV